MRAAALPTVNTGYVFLITYSEWPRAHAPKNAQLSGRFISDGGAVRGGSDAFAFFSFFLMTNWGGSG